MHRYLVFRTLADLMLCTHQCTDVAYHFSASLSLYFHLLWSVEWRLQGIQHLSCFHYYHRVNNSSECTQFSIINVYFFSTGFGWYSRPSRSNWPHGRKGRIHFPLNVSCKENNRSFKNAIVVSRILFYERCKCFWYVIMIFTCNRIHIAQISEF